MDSHGDQAGDVRDVRQQIRADLAGDFAHALEINHARIGAGADGDHARRVLARHRGELVVINPLVVLAHAVVDDLEKFAGEIRLVAVGQMPAVAQIHREHLVAGLEHGEINGHVRLAAGMRLDVGVLRAEQFFRAVNRQLLDDVNVFAAAIPAFFGIALGVFVREHRALGFQDGRADKIFAGDQLDVFLLALAFVFDGGGDGGIHVAQAQIRRGEARRPFYQRGVRGGRPRICADMNASRIFFASFGATFSAGSGKARSRRCAGASCRGSISSTACAGAHAGDLVGGDAHAHAAGADQQAKLGAAVGDGLRGRLREIGIIIRRVLRLRAEILHASGRVRADAFSALP